MKHPHTSLVLRKIDAILENIKVIRNDIDQLRGEIYGTKEEKKN